MSSAEFIFIGDLHFDKLKKHFGLEGLVKQVVEIEKVFTYAKTNGVRNLIFLGDICENVRLSVEAEFALLNMLRRTQDYKFNVHIILGNHDFAENNIHSLTLFSEICTFFIKNVKVYDSITDVEIDDIPFRFCPYPFTTGKSNAVNIGHFEVSGSTRDNGKVIKTAHDVRSKHQWVMGHLHTPHDIDNVHYVGTLYQTNFGEKNKKFFTHSTIEYEEGVLSIRHKRVRNTPAFEFINLIIEDESDLNLIEDDENKLYKLFINDGVDISDENLVGFQNIVDIKGYQTKQELKALQEEDFIEINEQTLDLPSISEGLSSYFKSLGMENHIDRAMHYMKLAKS